jgi:hypothetical protein
MKQYRYKDWSVEVCNETTYEVDSKDSNFNYSKQYNTDEEYRPTSMHGIKVFKEGELFNSCIVVASGGCTGVSETSSVIDGDQLLMCCSDSIFCLSLPDLQLNWSTRLDTATCFQIFKLDDDYLVHGEIEISRIDQKGAIKWKFGGADIFVSIDGEEEFKLGEDHILLTDFSKTKYKIDFDGNLLWDNYQRSESK